MSSTAETKTSENVDEDKVDSSETELYSHMAIRSFQPLRLLMLIFARLPLGLRLNLVYKYEFQFKWSHPLPYLFLVISILLLVQGLLVIVNTFGVVTNAPSIQTGYVVPDYFERSNYLSKVQSIFPNVSGSIKNGKLMLGPDLLRAEELFLFKRNAVLIIMIICCVIQGTAACFLFYSRRHFVAYFLTFILEAAEITRINLAFGLASFMWIFVLGWLASILLLVALTLMNVCPASGGLIGTVATLTYRVFYPPIHAINHKLFVSLQTLHGALFIFLLINSKIYLLLFIWCCKMIRNGFVTWNGRIDSVLLKDERKRSEKEKEIHRTTFEYLFNDHVIILDLIQGVDRIFAGIIEIYFLTQIISLGFVLYYIIRSIMLGDRVEFSAHRQRDILFFFVYVCQEVAFLYYVTMTAANINEEAIEGLEVIRQRGFIGERSETELHFVLSMYVSYTGHFDLAVVCANYFTMNNSLVILLLNSLCVVLIIIAQLSVKLDLTDRHLRNMLKKFCRIEAKNCTFYPVIWQYEGDILFGDRKGF